MYDVWYYWLVAFFICISLFEQELKDNGIFYDKDINSILAYLKTTDEIETTEKVENDDQPEDTTPLTGKVHIVFK